MLFRNHVIRRLSAAAQRADAMLEGGGAEGAAFWRRIVKAAKELQRAQPSLGEQIH